MIYYIIGVSGSGKTSVGKSLAHKLNIPFFDADDFHSPENVAKMAAGQPLTDDDRTSWLSALNAKACEQHKAGSGAVFACSGLKERYRETLQASLANHTQWVFLKGSYELIFERMKQRINHYMPAGLLKSQFETLEEPQYGLTVDIEQPVDEIVTQILGQTLPKREFGLVGLGVMGKSLARNLAKNGYKLALYNRYVQGTEEQVALKFVGQYAELNEAHGFENMAEFVSNLEQPRKIFLMVNAGVVTDAVINELEPLLNPGDIIIDGGNAHYTDTERRADTLAKSGIHFVGTGVSGGEEGALKGPSIMPGGNAEAYQIVAPFLTKIAAKDKDGNACCTWVGQGGAGHFVKMVHNGIEYAEMQLLAETYALLKYANGLNNSQIAELLAQWNQTELQSYLLEITADIFTKKDGENYVIDQILDKAGNKGTGNWTTTAMAEAGVPATLISSALFARYISAMYEQRQLMTQKYNFESNKPAGIEIVKIKEAYTLARLVNHQQGFELIQKYSDVKNWNINMAELTRIWTNGCIIRSKLMENYAENALPSLGSTALEALLESLRASCVVAITEGISMPCMLAAVDYLHAFLYQKPTAQVIQAQRDYFGAHTYQRIADPTGKYYHTQWL
jgi:6-phosphogluconate dehydrogenase